MKHRRWAWLALLLTVPALAAVGATTTPASAACQTAPYIADSSTASGTRVLGTWQKHYNANCDGVTEGDIWVTWHSWVNSSNHDRMVSIDMSVTSQAIQSNDCIQIAADWAGSVTGENHEDTQIMRNCKENSTRNMNEQVIDIDRYCSGATPVCSLNDWPMNRLQISTYSPDTGTIFNKVCLGGALAPGTNSGAECWGDGVSGTGWSPNDGFGSVAAKIYRRTNAGTNDQNDPTWVSGGSYPDHYDVVYLTTPHA